MTNAEAQKDFFKATAFSDLSSLGVLFRHENGSGVKKVRIGARGGLVTSTNIDVV